MLILALLIGQALGLPEVEKSASRQNWSATIQIMKAFVREHGATIVGVIVATLVITSLTGGSETVFYATAYASLAVGLLWEARKGRPD
jgi:hypothetical protein